MNVAILGATRGMGRALARAMAARGDRLFLLGRDPEDLERSAADLRARAGRDDAVTGTSRLDLERRESFAPGLDAAVRAFADAGGTLDAVITTAGAFAPQEGLEEDPDALARLLDVNFTATVLFLEEARRRLMAERSRGGAGVLVAFSSVAGERGRKPVVLYGATKAGLSAYLEGLDHRYRGQGLTVVSVKPGFVKTGMTAGLSPPPFAGEPEGVAQDVLRAIDRRRPEVYTPGPWRWVMLVIRNLPRAVMRRVGF